MKYIVTQPSNGFYEGTNGILYLNKENKGAKVGEVLNGVMKVKKVHTKLGVRTGKFLSVLGKPSGYGQPAYYIYLPSFSVKEVSPSSESSNFSGAEVVSKVGGADVLIPTGIFAGLGFIIGSILGEAKIQLTVGGAVVGGLIGLSSSGFSSDESKMSADGRKARIVIGKPSSGAIISKPSVGISRAEKISKIVSSGGNPKNMPSACEAWVYCDGVADPKGCSKLWKDCSASL